MTSSWNIVIGVLHDYAVAVAIMQRLAVHDIPYTFRIS